MVNDIVSFICNKNCVFTCHKAGCSRGSWCTSDFPSAAPLPPCGKDKTCPMMQFEAKKVSYDNSMRITENDTWNVCASCKYAKVYGSEVSIEDDSFAEHCLDCPVQQIRENI